MNKFSRFLIILLTIVTGGLFLYSAYTKLFPSIQSFEYTIVEFTHVPLIVAKIAARFFVSIEAAFGFLMVIHFLGYRKWVVKGALWLTVIFSLFLVYLWISAGNNVNCGCFGDNIFMKPSVSLLKNAVLIFILWLLNRNNKGFDYKWVRITAPILLVAIVSSIYIFFPVYEIYKLDIKSLYTQDRKFVPAIDLSKGKYVISFLSQSCGHCRKAATIMGKMKQNNPAIPFYMVIGGVESDLTNFWNETQSQNIPYTRLNKESFLKITGGVFPQIYLVSNGMVEESINYPELDQKLIEKWMK